jgi:hypothetical protein
MFGWLFPKSAPPPQFTRTPSPDVSRMVEVFFMTPEKDKCYFTAEYTTKNNDKLYAPKERLRYVGKYLNQRTVGSGDGAQVTSYFDNNGTTNEVNHSYGGNTCFLEDPTCSGVVSGGKRKRTRKPKRRTVKRKGIKIKNLF